MQQAIEKARVLIEALPYVTSFRRRFVVIKLGGSAMSDPDVTRTVLTDVVFMEQVGMWPVVVHGGGPRISEEMKRAGLEPRFVRGHRVTTKEALGVAERVLIDEISADICARVGEVGGKAIPLNGRSGFIEARRLRLEDAPDADLGLVGEVTRVDREMCYRLSDGGLVAVVAPIAREEGAHTHLNVNGDAAASAIAAGLGAEKLVFLSNVPGVLADPENLDSLISSLRKDDVDELLRKKTVSGGMVPKVKACLEALASGVKKTHIVSALLPHAMLLEIFTDRGVGTEIVR